MCVCVCAHTEFNYDIAFSCLCHAGQISSHLFTGRVHVHVAPLGSVEGSHEIRFNGDFFVCSSMVEI